MYIQRRIQSDTIRGKQHMMTGFYHISRLALNWWDESVAKSMEFAWVPLKILHDYDNHNSSLIFSGKRGRPLFFPLCVRWKPVAARATQLSSWLIFCVIISITHILTHKNEYIHLIMAHYFSSFIFISVAWLLFARKSLCRGRTTLLFAK